MKDFKSGNYISQGFYSSFQPEFINKNWVIDDMEVISLLSKADRNLGRLDMYSEYVDIDRYVRMHITKEATQSSKIEGTQTNMEDAFMSGNEISSQKYDDWVEVQNYIDAMNVAVESLHSLPFSSRLIKSAHKILLQGARGEYKLPGEYRTSQNWIGGKSINDAIFVPPIYTSINDLMSDLEKFANDNSKNIPDLLKIAIIHYQFETIHPFLDGNGRVGRLLITLYLVSTGILKRPILYLSDFFEKHRGLYYENLMRVRVNNDINEWLKFFLNGVIETAKKGVETFDRIMQLKQFTDEKLKQLQGRSYEAKQVIEHLYDIPIISVDKIINITGKSKVTSYKLIADLEKLGILKEASGQRRNKIYVFKEYMNLFD